MRRLLPLPLVVALVLGGAAVTARSDRAARERPLHAGHPEGRAKRARALVSEAARAGSGRAALSPDGEERGYDVLTYDLRFELDPAVVALEGSAVIRLAALRPGSARPETSSRSRSRRLSPPRSGRRSSFAGAGPRSRAAP